MSPCIQNKNYVIIKRKRKEVDGEKKVDENMEVGGNLEVDGYMEVGGSMAVDRSIAVDEESMVDGRNKENMSESFREASLNGQSKNSFGGHEVQASCDASQNLSSDHDELYAVVNVTGYVKRWPIRENLTLSSFSASSSFSTASSSTISSSSSSSSVATACDSSGDKCT